MFLLEVEVTIDSSLLKHTRVYQEAKEEGRKEVYQEAKEEGREEGKLEVVLEIVPKLLQRGLSI